MFARFVSRGVCGLAVGLVATGGADAASAWRIRHGNGQIWAETATQTHGSLLLVQCDEANKSVSLILQPPASWNGDAGYKMMILIDDKPFAAAVDGADEGAVLSNLPKDAIGIDAQLRRAIKGGHSLVLEGPPAAAISLRQRTFSLEGAAVAVDRIENSCPGVR